MGVHRHPAPTAPCSASTRAGACVPVRSTTWIIPCSASSPKSAPTSLPRRKPRRPTAAPPRRRPAAAQVPLWRPPAPDMIGSPGSRACPPLPGTSIPALLAAALLAMAAPAAADIYRLIDERGVIHLSNKPMGDDWKLIVRTRKAWSPDRVRPMPENRTRFWPLVDAAARRHGLNQALIDAAT